MLENFVILACNSYDHFLKTFLANCYYRQYTPKTPICKFSVFAISVKKLYIIKIMIFSGVFLWLEQVNIRLICAMGRC